MTNIEMPVKDGVSLTKDVRAGLVPGCPRNLPLIAITGFARTGERELFMAQGLDDCLAKPFYIYS